MAKNILEEIKELDIPYEVKEKLESIIIDNVYITYKHIEEIINDLPLNLQTTILSYVYKINKKLYDKEIQIQRELQTIKNIKESISIPNEIKPKTNNVYNNQNAISKSNELELDISDYMQAISVIENIEDLENLEEILPTPDIKQYKNYITKILLELYKDFKDIKDLLNSPLEDEVRQDFTKELKLIKEKIDYISDYHQEQLLQDNVDEEINQNTNINNKIIYLSTSSGTPYALKDIKSIDPVYYESLNILLNSIINGTFKNFKAFSGANNNIGTISEVRGFKTRIIYDRIANDTYIILRILIKKINNDAYYQTAISDRYLAYKKQKEQLRSLLESVDFLNENQNVTEEIQNIFNNRARKGNM